MHPPKTNDSQEMLTLLRSHLYDVNNAGESCSKTFRKMRDSLRSAGMCIARIIDPEIKQMAFDYYKEHDPISNGTASKDLVVSVLGSKAFSDEALQVTMWRSGALSQKSSRGDLPSRLLIKLIDRHWSTHRKQFLSILAEWNIANNFGYVGSDHDQTFINREAFFDTWDDYHDNLIYERFLPKYRRLSKSAQESVLYSTGPYFLGGLLDGPRFLRVLEDVYCNHLIDRKCMIDQLHKELHRLRGDL